MQIFLKACWIRPRPEARDHFFYLFEEKLDNLFNRVGADLFAQFIKPAPVNHSHLHLVHTPGSILATGD